MIDLYMFCSFCGYHRLVRIPVKVFDRVIRIPRVWCNNCIEAATKAGVRPVNWGADDPVVRQ